MDESDWVSLLTQQPRSEQVQNAIAELGLEDGQLSPDGESMWIYNGWYPAELMQQLLDEIARRIEDGNAV